MSDQKDKNLMVYMFNVWSNPALFHTGLCVESHFAQALIVHGRRTNEFPFIQSRASWLLIAISMIIVTVSALVKISPTANTFGLVVLHPLYWLYLAGLLICYVLLAQFTVTWS